ncbi:MAG: ABC transporter permease [Patescibacteria group bacterium]|jgi:putative ABC transport system permease protein
MMLITHVQTALRQLLSNKAKSALTMLGIIIGIGSVILIMTLGEIAKQFLLGQISQFGTNVIEVASTGSFGPFKEEEPITFSLQDAEALERSSLLSDMEAISAAYTSAGTLEYDSKKYQIMIWGDKPAVFTINKLDVLAGRTFTDAEVNRSDRVIVLSQKFAEDVFDTSANAIGKTVTVSGRAFTVLGVVNDPPMSGGPFGGSYTYFPITTTYAYLAPAADNNKVIFLMISTKPETDTELFKDRLSFELKRIKHLDDAQMEGISVASREQMLSIFNNVLLGIQMFVAAIAGISLFVGGIGIMNIMLVTVKERTKEIGLRKAVGAKNSSILIQFLIEAAVLTTVGGLIGIGSALGLANLAVFVVNIVQPTWAIHFVLVPSAIILACAVSMSTGFIFGLYPAMKAAKLHPIEALRYE